MKKLYYLGSILLIILTDQINAQVLNQNASWPNASWNIVGTYNPISIAFEADPRITTNFAYDDNHAGAFANDFIAAESPIINLTNAYNAGETTVILMGDYVFNQFSGAELLKFEYWNSDLGIWSDWGFEFTTDTTNAPFDQYCNGETTSYLSTSLDISSFTPSQLTGFKYRISYDDDIAGGALFQYGFCFNSPTIVSSVPLSIEENTIEGFTLYPNPVENTLNFKAKNNIDSLIIYNVLGQEVISFLPNISHAKLDVTKLQAGVYIVKASSGAQKTSCRFIKEYFY